MTITLTKNRTGLSLLEIIVAIAIASVVMGAVVTFMGRVIHFKGTQTRCRGSRSDAFEVLYRENVRRGRELRRLDQAILPSVDDDDKSGRTLMIYTGSDAVVSAFREAKLHSLRRIATVPRRVWMDTGLTTPLRQ